MNTLFTLLAHILRNIAVVFRPGGSKSIIAENLLLKQQLLVLNRSRRRAPNIPPIQRLFLAFCGGLLEDRRIERAAITLRPSTLFRLHSALVRKKYRDLFSSRPQRKPGPKGPCSEVIQAIVEFKRRNPRWGCPRIAEQISNTFGIQLDKDTVRRILANTSNLLEPTVGHPGLRCWATPRIVYGVSTCFGLNRSLSRLIGSLS